MKYVKAKTIPTEYSLLQLRGKEIISYGNDLYGVKDEVDISSFISEQPAEIEAMEVSYEVAKPILENSFMMKEFNKIIERKIAERYSVGKEFKMRDLPADDPERLEYEQYKSAIKAEINEKKRALGLIK